MDAAEEKSCDAASLPGNFALSRIKAENLFRTGTSAAPPPGASGVRLAVRKALKAAYDSGLAPTSARAEQKTRLVQGQAVKCFWG